ncbi:MAG TPA: hypothetical protein VLH94_02705 [Spirochaetia bacterium]|nr:hypothetical protein [Spirochaetia bacterium]
MTIIDYIQDPNFISMSKDVLLVIGFWVTYKSFTTAARQLRASEMPFLKVVYEKKQGEITPDFYLQNVGKGVCHSISFEPFFLILTDVKVVWRLCLSLSGSNILASGNQDKVKLDLKVKTFGIRDEEKTSTDLIKYFYQEKGYPLNIYFGDSIGKSYVMRMAVGHDIAELISAPVEETIRTSLPTLFRSIESYIKIYVYLVYWRILSFLKRKQHKQ